MKLKKYTVHIKLFFFMYSLMVITFAAVTLGAWFIESRRSDASSFIENPVNFVVGLFALPLILLTLIACLDIIRNKKNDR